MADLAAHTIRETSPRGVNSHPIADAVTLYVGALVGLESGYANHWASGANDVFLGIVVGGKDRGRDGILLGETDDTPDPHVWVDETGVTLMHLDSVGGTPTQAKVGDVVYCATSNTDDITMTSTGNHPVGWLSYFRSATDVDVTLFTPGEHLAQATA